MANTYTKWAWPFDSGPSGTIPFSVDAADYTATIAAPASFYAVLGLRAADPQVAVDLIRTIRTAMNTATGGAPAIEVDVDDTFTSATYGLVSAYAGSGVFKWRWTAGHTFDETTLGFTAGADVTAPGVSQRAYAQAQHENGWRPRDVFAEDRLSRPAATVATQRATSGVRRTYRFNTSTHRDVRFDFLSRTDILTSAATGTNLNRDFEQLWGHLSQGRRVYYFPSIPFPGQDLTDVSFLSTLRDKGDMEEFSAVADLMFPTVEFWRVALRLEAYTAP